MPSLRTRFGYWLINSLVPAVFPRINPLARWLLRSPLHPIASLFVITLRFHGAASGRTYEVPLAYHRRGDGVLEAVTSRCGRWWRNLVSHPNAKAVYRGRTHAAHVDVSVDDLASIEGALRSRDVWRGWLLPVAPQETVLLWVTLGSSGWRRERGRLV